MPAVADYEPTDHTDDPRDRAPRRYVAGLRLSPLDGWEKRPSADDLPPSAPPDRVTRTAGYAVAIVTGGSRSDGREIVRALASQGCAIVVVYLEDQSKAEATVEEVLAAGGAAFTVRADLTDDLDVERVFKETIAAFAGVDVVVHTTTRGASVLYEHASRHLRPGSAIFSLFSAGQLAPMLAQRLRERDVTINGAPPGVGHSGGGHEVSDLLAMLDQWKDQRAP